MLYTSNDVFVQESDSSHSDLKLCFCHNRDSYLNQVPIKVILDTHKSRTVSCDLDSPPSRAYILRGQLWKTACTAFKRASFDVTREISVVFLGEPAEDYGGPLREFFTLLVHQIPRTGLFEGRPNHYIPTHDTTRVMDGEYYLAGKMIAASIVHGGRAPNCFSKAFAEKVVLGEVKTEPNPMDVPDPDIRSKIMKVDKNDSNVRVGLEAHTPLDSTLCCMIFSTTSLVTINPIMYIHILCYLYATIGF